MTRIHLVTGDKGNVGKSAWCTALIEYYRYHNKPLELIDADSDSQTMTKVYSEAFPLMLSDNRAYAAFVDDIYEITFKEIQKKDAGGDVLVDLPAGGEKFINKWIDDCSMIERAKQDKVEIYKWWVSDSDAASIQLFEEDVVKYPSIHHIFLKNMGRSHPPQWIGFDKRKKIKAMIKSGEIRVLEIPDLTLNIIDDLREAGARLSDVLADKTYEKFGLGTNMRVNGWVDKTRAFLVPIITLEKAKAKVTAKA